MSSYKLIDEESGDATADKACQTNDVKITEIVEHAKADCLLITKGCSLIIGLIVGGFIQCSILAANFMLESMYGKEVYATEKFVQVSLVWCFITAVMGVSVLLFLRNLVVVSFYASNSGPGDKENLKDKEDFMVRVIDLLERSFAIGSILGVGLGWTVTDCLLGLESHVLQSAFTLGVALLCCRFAFNANTAIFD